MKNHSFLQQEDEILLLPARQLVVTSCLGSGNGLHIIQLKEIEPKIPLLEHVSLLTAIPQPEKSPPEPELSGAHKPTLKCSISLINLSGQFLWSVEER